MKPHSIISRAAALPRSFPSLPTEIWLEICGYLSYGQLVAVIGRLSRYHRKLLASSSLDKQLFRKATSEEEQDRFLFCPDQKRIATHPLLSKVVWIGSEHDFDLAQGTRRSILTIPISPLSEHATLPPIASLPVQTWSCPGEGGPSPSMLVHRSTGVTVKDVLAVARDYLFSRPITGESGDFGYSFQDTDSTLEDEVLLIRGKTLTFSSYASTDGNNLLPLLVMAGRD